MYSPYGSSYSVLTRGLSSFDGALVWTIIAAVIAVVGGIVLYFTFLNKKNEGKFNGFLGWMYDFLNFKKLIIESILRICYLIVAIFITLSSFSVISVSFVTFLIYLIFGNIIARISYELLLVLLTICKNTTEINSKMKKSEDKAE